MEGQRIANKRTLIMLVLAFFLTACSSNMTNVEPSASHIKKQPKDIMVFFDGTANDEDTDTNIFKLYQLVNKHGSNEIKTEYIEGVGSAGMAPIFGMTLGSGMQSRILRGYEHIASNYSEGDRIFIFGFSRGALQARSLAGLISYAGLPSNKEKASKSKRILNLVKKESDADHQTYWNQWKPGTEALMADAIKDKYGIATYPVEITFLGLWDTVPGSSFKEYGICKEVADMRKGDRYKTDTYPVIKHISHAVAMDEKRSKFWPLLICPPLNPKYSTVNEVWFPGAHADVGGGYNDSNDLPLISLKWMINELKKQFSFNEEPKLKNGNPRGLAHWSIGDRPANTGSLCRDREPLMNKSAIKVHQSYLERLSHRLAPLRVNNQRKDLIYPITCNNNLGLGKKISSEIAGRK